MAARQFLKIGCGPTGPHMLMMAVICKGKIADLSQATSGQILPERRFINKFQWVV